jgi:hypothetical protein
MSTIQIDTDNIVYSWSINNLQVLSDPLNGFSDIVRKITWNLIASLEFSGETYSELSYGEIIIDVSKLNLDNDTFVPFENLTKEIVISWIEQQKPNIKEDIKNRLLDRNFYKVKYVNPPWKQLISEPEPPQEEIDLSTQPEPINITSFSSEESTSSIPITPEINTPILDDPPPDFVYT